MLHLFLLCFISESYWWLFILFYCSKPKEMQHFLPQAAEELCMLSCLCLFFSRASSQRRRLMSLVWRRDRRSLAYPGWEWRCCLCLLRWRRTPTASSLCRSTSAWCGSAKTEKTPLIRTRGGEVLLFKAPVPEDRAGSWFQPKFVYGNLLITVCLLTRLCYGKMQNRLLIQMISTPNLSARNLREQPGGALCALEVEAESAVRFPEVLFRHRTSTFSGLVFQ